MPNFNIFRLKLETKDIERFILRVKNHPVLYDTILKDLKKNREIKAQARASPAFCNTDFPYDVCKPMRSVDCVTEKLK
jgi:hypothetical protein